MFKRSFALASILTLGLVDYACAADAPAVPSVDYAASSVWLCRPGRQDACTAPQDATIVAVDGTLTREAFHAAKVHIAIPVPECRAEIELVVQQSVGFRVDGHLLCGDGKADQALGGADP